jgi:hypothetical protein
MKVGLIKYYPKYDEMEEIVGVAASKEAAKKYMEELHKKWPYCYQQDLFEYVEFELIEE